LVLGFQGLRKEPPKARLLIFSLPTRGNPAEGQYVYRLGAKLFVMIVSNIFIQLSARSNAK